jgi:altronate hydrolase
MNSTTISGVNEVLRLASDDNVVLALREVDAGGPLGTTGVVARDVIPAGHKAAIVAIPAGEPIRKYGQIIGFASVRIEPGDHVHLHNVAVRAFERDAAAGIDATPTAFIVPPATFQGIVRADGRVATRNYLGVVTTVNCSATAARYIADKLGRELEGHPTIDGVVAITHTAGCGMAAEGEAMDVLRRTIGGYVAHPNFAGVLLLGLGCEDNQIDRLMKAVGLTAGPMLGAMTIQDAGGTAATVARGVDMLREMVPDAAKATRTTVPASELKLALQCGGSDGYSGITANPALGACVDLLVRNGGTAILGETPEIYAICSRGRKVDQPHSLVGGIRGAQRRRDE